MMGRVSSWVSGVLLVLLVSLAGCGGEVPPVEIPDPELSAMEPQVRRVVREARTTVEASPGSAEAWGELGMVCDVHEIDACALAAYRRAAELEPDEPRWSYLLGRLLAIEGTDLEAAVERFERVVELAPEYVPARQRLADVQVRRGRLERAEVEYRRALALDPGFARAHLGLGQVLLARAGAAGADESRHLLEEAVTHLERARELAPADGTPLAPLSQAYLRLGREEEAREAARRSRELPRLDGFPDPWLGRLGSLGVSSSIAQERGVGLLEAGRFEAASGELSKVVAARPEDPFAHLSLARALRGAGRPAAALESLERALELKPDLVAARLDYGLLLLERGRVEEALEPLRRASEALEAQGDREGDVESRRQLLAAHEALGQAMLSRGEVPVGLGHLRRAEELGDLSADSYVAWGSALAQESRFREARELFRRAVEADPESARAHANLGLVHEALGRPEEAVEQYRRALELGGDPLAESRLRALGSSPVGPGF